MKNLQHLNYLNFNWAMYSASMDHVTSITFVIRKKVFEEVEFINVKCILSNEYNTHGVFKVQLFSFGIYHIMRCNQM